VTLDSKCDARPGGTGGRFALGCHHDLLMFKRGQPEPQPGVLEESRVAGRMLATLQ
jgi:hypothetical protein